jgi:hypothetical protein
MRRYFYDMDGLLFSPSSVQKRNDWLRDDKVDKR